MKLIKVTVVAAVPDYSPVSADGLANALVNQAINCDCEVAFTVSRVENTYNYPDVDYETDSNDAIEEWDSVARNLLEARYKQ